MKRIMWSLVAGVVVLGALLVALSHEGNSAPSNGVDTTSTVHSPGNGVTPASVLSTTSSDPSGTATRVWYLAVGASSSLGYQPMGIPGGREHPTKTSYTNDVVSLGATRGMSIELSQIGCPGETYASMLTSIDHCYSHNDGQLARALAYLTLHREDRVLVTVDLGFNDVRKCLTAPTFNEACAQAGLDSVRSSIDSVLSQLKSAAGPHTFFVGLTTDDPFLAHYLDGESGRTDAAGTLRTMDTLNSLLRAKYEQYGVTVADVSTAFATDDERLVTMQNGVTVPRNVANVCAFTWMCQAAPWGPDDHPNNEGFALIAKTVWAVVPTSW